MGYWYKQLSNDATKFPKRGSKVWEWIFTLVFFSTVVFYFGWPWGERSDVWLLIAVVSYATERMTFRMFARGDRLVEESIYRVRKVDDPCLSNARYFPLLGMATKDVASRSGRDLVIEFRDYGNTGWNWQRLCQSAEEAKAMNENSEFDRPRWRYLEK